jgi:hypothetical protein
VPAVEWQANLPDAVTEAVRAAQPGDHVLLSPACPYFFRQYYLSDGDELGFRTLLRRLTTETSLKPS